MNTTGTLTPGGAADERWSVRWVGRLSVLVLVSEVIPVSASLVATALPAISAEYQTTQSSWAMTASFLAAAVSMPLIGKLADLAGKKKLLLWVLALTIAGSVLSAVAPTFWVFIIGRVLQGASFALAFLCYSLIRDLFPPRLVTFAVSVTVTGTGLVVIGQPFLAGWLIDGYGVAGVFWFLAVLTAVLLTLAVIAIPQTSVRAPESKPDFVGAALLGFGVAAVLLGVSFAPEIGFLSTSVLVLVLAGLALLAGWIVQATRTSQPLIDLRLLGSRSLLPIVGAGGLVYGAGASVGLVLPMLTMTPRELGGGYGFGLTATQYAIFGVISGVGLVAGGLIVGVTARRGARLHLIVSAVLMVVGVIGSALYKGDYGLLLGATAVASLGLGIGAAAIPNLVIESVPPERQVISSSIVEVSRTLIASIITSVVFVVLNSNIGRIVQGRPIYSPDGFDGAYLALGLTIAAGGVVALLIRRSAPVPADTRTVMETQ
ncbi:MFS transporter [Streptosporangium sp. NPDC002607]